MGNQKSKKKSQEYSENRSNLKLINYLDTSQRKSIFQTKYKNNDSNSNKIIINDINIINKKNSINKNKNEILQHLSPKRKKKLSEKKNVFEKSLKIVNLKPKKIIKVEAISKNTYNEISSRRSNVSENSSLLLLNPNQLIIKRANSLFNTNKKEKYKHQFSLFEYNKNNNIQNSKKTSTEKYLKEVIYNINPSYNLPQLTEKATLKTLKDTFSEDITSDSTKNTKNINDNYYKEKDINIKNIEDISIDKIKGLFIKKPKNFRYIGLKINNIKNGFGIILWEDNHELIGTFIDNKVNNYCRFSDNNSNSKYEGYYINNKPNGFGIFQSTKKGTRIQGEWKNDKINGIGIQIWNDSSLYYGEFKDQLKNGIGTYKWENGTIYKGEFKNNKIQGMGIFIYENGNYYEGEVYDGELNGFGFFSWNNDKKYIGYYKDGKKDGFGIFINGIKKFYLNCLITFWSKGKIHGPFIKINNNKAFYGVYRSGIKIKDLQSGVMCLTYLDRKKKTYWNLFNMNTNQLIKYIYNLLIDKIK